MSRRWADLSPVKLGALIFVAALGFRLAYGLLVSGTYDYDEFVLLLLARDYAHGSVPYTQFMFFHPPGVLVFLRVLQPLISDWWPIARIAESLIDSVTAVLVFTVGYRTLDRRSGCTAGLVYAASPLALITGVRVDQDALITCAGTAALTCLLLGRTARWSFFAGALLGVAVWLKYPAVYFIPICCVAAPRRAPLVLAVALGTFVLLLLPFGASWHALYEQTITFQRLRWTMPVNQRVETTAIFWFGINALALPALFRRPPFWLWIGFMLGSLYAFSPQTYYHYFDSTLPFAALLTGRSIRSFGHRAGQLSAVWLVACAVAGGMVVDFGGRSPLFVTAARLSDISPAVRLIQSHTRSSDPVLGDRFEYAYLSNRPALAHYFWNVGVLVDATYLERGLSSSGAVVLSSGPSSGYPPGLIVYMNRRYKRVDQNADSVWLTRQVISEP